MSGIKIVKVRQVGHQRVPIPRTVMGPDGIPYTEEPRIFDRLPVRNVTERQAHEIFFQYVKDYYQEDDPDVEGEGDLYTVNKKLYIQDAKANYIELLFSLTVKTDPETGSIVLYPTSDPTDTEELLSLPTLNSIHQLRISMRKVDYDEDEASLLFVDYITKGKIMTELKGNSIVQGRQLNPDDLSRFEIYDQSLQVTVDVYPEVIAAAMFKTEIEKASERLPDLYMSGSDVESRQDQMAQDAIKTGQFLYALYQAREEVLRSPEANQNSAASESGGDVDFVEEEEESDSDSDMVPLDVIDIVDSNYDMTNAKLTINHIYKQGV